jgi:putative tryptophan/tyrosine transport system substrate-binding protein
MQRREFIAGLVAAAAWRQAAWAQQARTPAIGFLGPDSPAMLGGRLRAFHQGLGEAGYVEGRNVAIEYRWAENDNDRIPDLVADLVRHGVDVIATPGSTAGAIAAKALTRTVPIVFATGADPVRNGLVASLSRPGGNLTGVTLLGVEIGQKQLQLLHEVLPSATTMALLVNPTNASIAGTTTKELQAAARTLGLELYVVNAGAERDFDAVFASLARLRPGGLIIAPDIFFGSRLSQLGALTLQHGVPAIHQFRAFAVAGGLMSYGTDVADAFRLAGVYTGRILKGEKPTDLPVQQSTKIELLINVKTAKALGLVIPETLLATADAVIQ